MFFQLTNLFAGIYLMISAAGHLLNRRGDGLNFRYAFLYINAGFILANNANITDGLEYVFPAFAESELLSMFWVGPAIFGLLLPGEAGTEQKLRRLLTLLPLVVLIWLIPFYGVDAGTKNQTLQAMYLEGRLETVGYLYLTGMLYTGLILIYTFSRFLKGVSRHFREDKVSLFYGLLIGYSLVATAVGAAGFFFGFIFIRLAVFLIATGVVLMHILSFRFPWMHQLPELVKSQSQPDKTAHLKNVDVTSEAAKLEKLMADEALFRDPDLTMPKLANRLGLSLNQTSQLLNQHIGATFSEYINRIRTDFAAKLLSETDEAVIDIAYSAGYNSLSAFNRVFKLRFDLPPSKYRAANRS